ncbi:MAG: hypothetical protein SNJ63_04435 [Sphingomonadaceae bacterium]
MALLAPVFDAEHGTLRAGAVRGPDCQTAMELIVFLKEKAFGVDRVLAHGRRTLRDGRVDLVHACGPARDMKVYVQVGDTRETKRKSPVVVLSGCG